MTTEAPGQGEIKNFKAGREDGEPRKGKKNTDHRLRLREKNRWGTNSGSKREGVRKKKEGERAKRVLNRRGKNGEDS